MPTTVSKKSSDAARRRFMQDLGRHAILATVLGTGLSLYARQSSSLPAQALRPPGALDEAEFASACLRCGLCVRACPFDTLHLAQLGDDLGVGTPYFNARDVACEMCDDIPCVQACPSGALDPALQKIDDARMGLAVLLDQENCLNFQGLRCEVCYRVCPAIDRAITLAYRSNVRSGKHAIFIPTVHADACTGCGKCEHACVLENAAIKVLPRRLAKGELGQHYRWGWREKENAGSSLVSPDTEHRYHLPDDKTYDFDGAGLLQDTEK